jgi:prolipoprotein diacylglyceryltransferase
MAILCLISHEPYNLIICFQPKQIVEVFQIFLLFCIMFCTRDGGVEILMTLRFIAFSFLLSTGIRRKLKQGLEV